MISDLMSLVFMLAPALPHHTGATTPKAGVNPNTSLPPLPQAFQANPSAGYLCRDM